MGQRGPARTPTATLQLAGSRRGRERAENGPDFGAGVGECPVWLDEDSRREWERLADLLTTARVLQQSDRDTLERYCRTLTRWRRAELFIESSGETYTTDGGVIRDYPAVATAGKLAIQLLKLGAEMGLTPASRSRVAIVKPTAKSTPAGKDKARFFTTNSA